LFDMTQHAAIFAVIERKGTARTGYGIAAIILASWYAVT
jgi:hypothetical protein